MPGPLPPSLPPSLPPHLFLLSSVAAAATASMSQGPPERKTATTRPPRWWRIYSAQTKGRREGGRTEGSEGELLDAGPARKKDRRRTSANDAGGIFIVHELEREGRREEGKEGGAVKSTYAPSLPPSLPPSLRLSLRTNLGLPQVFDAEEEDEGDKHVDDTQPCRHLPQEGVMERGGGTRHGCCCCCCCLLLMMKRLPRGRASMLVSVPVSACIIN